MYKVIKSFVDLRDKNHLYKVGDTFPKVGSVASENRIAELSSDKNKIGVPLIEKVEEPKKKKTKRTEDQGE